jgi:hypothetical protein
MYTLVITALAGRSGTPKIFHGLDHGTETFLDYLNAKEFADRHANKGLNAQIFKGNIMPMEFQTSVKEMRGK